MIETLPSGIKLHVQDLPPASGVAPSGKTVVLIHGLIIDDLSSYYFTLANPLSMAGHRVIMYDLRGHGASDRPATGYSVADGVDDLRELLIQMKIQDPVHLVGNSYGGAIAMGMAVTYPELVADVALIEGLYADVRFGEEMSETLGFLSKCIYEQKWRDWLAARDRKTNKVAQRGISLIDNTTIREDLLSTAPYPNICLQALQIPLLAIYGSASDIFWRAQKLAALVPQTRLIVLPGLDHRVLFNASPYVARVLEWWLAGHTGEAPMWIPPDIPFEPAPLSRAMLLDQA
ncbi:alpha/beta fold hydrolase [Silvibacterium sp.]|uniref:alpha/beta fold hydrolase n=1 Tax=Silvibacterium sp. TaxID=1964179 RepID=UPI0039E4D619